MGTTVIELPIYRFPPPIPVSERLPEVGEVCLGWWNDRWTITWLDGPPGEEIGWYYEGAGGYDYYTKGNDSTPTHWLPLPPAPDAATH